MYFCLGLFILYGCLLSTNSSVLTCFNCQGIRHPRFCEYVKDCLDGQVCGLERQMESNGAVIFNLGCLSNNTCNTNPSIIDGRQKCFHCCSTHLCNINGCGEPDNSMINGTVCYSCLGLLQPNNCQSVSFCDQSEMCYLEEKTHFGEKFYHSGCREKHICEAQFISYPIIGRRGIVTKRSTKHVTCCDQSLCNDKCEGIKQTTPRLHMVSTSYSTHTTASSTKAQNICTMNQQCYNGGTCQNLSGSDSCSCAVGYLGRQCEYSDGKDTSFLVIFHEGFQNYPPKPKIFVASRNTTLLLVSYFNNNQNKSVTMDKSNTEYNLSSSVFPSDGMHLAGVELHSDVKINVYGFFNNVESSEGYVAMPIRFASTKYIISSLPAFVHGYENLLALTPVYQNTIVNIHLKLQNGSILYEKKQYRNNDTLRMVMNKYNTFQLSHTSDLSGTLVTASKPVIVVSGSQCNYALPTGFNVGSCQPFIESVLPTDQLDNVFITPHISTRVNNTVRIQAVNNTNLNIIIGDRKTSKTLNARDYFDFYYTDFSIIRASADILVVSYPDGIKRADGDTFMMTIPGVNQYLYEYDFVVPTGFDSFISITVQSDTLDGFLLDGNFVTIPSVLSISDGMDHFTSLSFPISAGLHYIAHRQKLRFGLWVYGNKHAYDGYGYPAGMAFKIYN